MVVLHHTLGHRMSLHLQKIELVTHFALPMRTSTVDRLCILISLLHPLTLIQNYFTYCIIFLLLVDEKGVNSGHIALKSNSGFIIRKQLHKP